MICSATTPGTDSVEMLHLAQQATLEMRNPKHQPPLGGAAHATAHRGRPGSGGPEAVHAALHPSDQSSPKIDAGWAAAADRVRTVIEEHGFTWQIWPHTTNSHPGHAQCCFWIRPELLKPRPPELITTLKVCLTTH